MSSVSFSSPCQPAVPLQAALAVLCAWIFMSLPEASLSLTTHFKHQTAHLPGSSSHKLPPLSHIAEAPFPLCLFTHTHPTPLLTSALREAHDAGALNPSVTGERIL